MEATKDISDLRREKDKLTLDLQALSDRAEQGGRDLNPDEQRRFREGMARAHELAAELQRREIFGGSLTWGPGMVWHMNPELGGGPVRSLKPSERMADYLRPRFGSVNLEELRFSDWMSGVVTGRWRGPHAAELRDMSVANQVAGGFLVPEALSARIIDLVRAKSVVIAAGAETIPMDSATLPIGRITSDPSASWKAENTAVTSSDINVGVLTLQAKTLVALVKMSVEWAEDVPNGVDVVENGLAQALALELDRAAIRGAGGLEPTGILNHPGVVQTSLGGLGMIVDNLVSAVIRMRANNHEPNAILWHPTQAGEYSQLKDGEGRYLVQSEHPDIAKLLHLTSTQVLGTSGSGEVYVIDGTKVLIGVRTNLTVEFSREASDGTTGAFTSLQIWARAYLRADVMLQYPAAAEVLTNVL